MKNNYEIGIIKSIFNKFPEINLLVGDVQFTPESFGIDKQNLTYGKMFFSQMKSENLKEFDRTILSVILLNYIKDNKYKKFVKSQNNNEKLTKKTFDKIRNLVLGAINTNEKEELLLYYLVINDLGKAQSMISFLENLNIKTDDHDEVLKEIIKLNKLPTLHKFSKTLQKNLFNVLKYGVNIGQLIQGECVDYSFNNINKLNEFEKMLMLSEATLDIAGVLGHINQKGSVILNQPNAENVLMAAKAIIENKQPKHIFNDFLKQKQKVLNINLDKENADVERTICRLCLMLRLNNKADVNVVINQIVKNKAKYQDLIKEFNETGYNNKFAILPYYAPAMLNNTNNFYKKQGIQNSLQKTLNVCLPYLQNEINNARSSIASVNEKNGIYTLMLRESAIKAAQNPESLITDNDFLN